MNPRSLRIEPFAAESMKPHRTDPALLDLIATAHFWRLRAVEFTILGLICFGLGFAIACRL